MTYHPTDNGAFAVILNHRGENRLFALEIEKGYAVDKVYYGSATEINAYDACVFKITKA